MHSPYLDSSNQPQHFGDCPLPIMQESPTKEPIPYPLLYFSRSESPTLIGHINQNTPFATTPTATSDPSTTDSSIKSWDDAELSEVHERSSNSDVFAHLPALPASSAELRLQCSECDVRFSKNYQLTKHYNQIHNRRFRCPVDGCDSKAFGLRTDLKRHMDTHKTENVVDRFSCKEDGCSQVFSRRDNLFRHVRNSHG